MQREFWVPQGSPVAPRQTPFDPQTWEVQSVDKEQLVPTAPVGQTLLLGHTPDRQSLGFAQVEPGCP